MTIACPKCGAATERGFTTAKGLIGGDEILRRKSQLLFYVPGPQTSSNPLKAFQQGLDEESTRAFPITGTRCTDCGYLEFYAQEPSEYAD